MTFKDIINISESLNPVVISLYGGNNSNQISEEDAYHLGFFQGAINVAKKESCDNDQIQKLLKLLKDENAMHAIIAHIIECPLKELILFVGHKSIIVRAIVEYRLRNEI